MLVSVSSRPRISLNIPKFVLPATSDLENKIKPMPMFHPEHDGTNLVPTYLIFEKAEMSSFKARNLSRMTVSGSGPPLTLQRMSV